MKTMASYGEDDESLAGYIKSLPGTMSLALTEISLTPDGKKVSRQSFTDHDAFLQHMSARVSPDP